MLRRFLIGLLATAIAIAIAPLPLEAHEGSSGYQTRNPSDGVGLEPGQGTWVNNEPAPPDERLNEQN